MDPHSRNFILTPPQFGPFIVNPSAGPCEAVRLDVAFILCPDPLTETQLDAAASWAMSTDAPFYCTAGDAQRLIERGFSDDRFQQVLGPQEISFQGGTLIFHPVRGLKASGVRGLWERVRQAYQRPTPSAFHMLIKPDRSPSLLYLSSPYLDALEARRLLQHQPSVVVGSDTFADEAWWALSERLGCPIVRADTWLRGPGKEILERISDEGTKTWLPLANSAI